MLNEQSLAALVEQLEGIGLEKPLSQLLKKICFQPDKFSYVQQVTKSGEGLSVSCWFERGGDDVYRLAFYEVALLPTLSLDTGNLSNIDISTLDQDMAAVDWDVLFDANNTRLVLLEDKTSWAQEALADSVVTRLKGLETTAEGKDMASLLKAKYWTQAGGVAPVTKNGISQRFYPNSEGRNITVDEACRFLQNKRLERQLIIHKKQGKSDVATDNKFKKEGSARQRSKNRPASKKLHNSTE